MIVKFAKFTSFFSFLFWLTDHLLGVNISENFVKHNESKVYGNIKIEAKNNFELENIDSQKVIKSHSHFIIRKALNTLGFQFFLHRSQDKSQKECIH